MKITRKKIIIIISFIVLLFNIILFPKKRISFNSQVDTQIAKAIIVLEKDETIDKEANKDDFPIEYFFEIKNFDNNNNINEIDLKYKIKIESSKKNFPIKYKLVDLDNNIDIQLIDNESELMLLEKNQKEIRHFKLFVDWNDIDYELAEDTEINIKVEAIQGGKVNCVKD